ncbi:uncharacterized protein V1510DRAFT_365272 [Dipodascopsis tothii]|uniref:uncharacterized protein n=1 Tax=Dipodascopsis tothii TaxID=44089 RepID=UPI0034CE96F6
MGKTVKPLLWLVPAVADLVLSNMLLAVTRVLAPRLPSYADPLTCMVAASFWGYLYFFIETVKRFQVSFSGDPLAPEDSALLICNHRSYADYVLIYALSLYYRMQGRCRFLVWRNLFTLPSLRWLLSSVLIPQNWSFSSETRRDKLFRRAQLSDGPTWIVLFPESAKYSLELAYEHIQFCRQNGLPKMTQCLYPRFEAFVPVVQHLQETKTVANVYDLTFVYRRADDAAGGVPPKAPSAADDQAKVPETLYIQPDEAASVAATYRSAPRLWDVLFGPPQAWELHVHVRRLTVEQLPTSRYGLEKWLEKAWTKKNKLLEGVAKKGMAYKGLGEVYFPNDDIFLLEE